MKFNKKNIKIAVIYYCYNRLDHTSKSFPKIIKYKKKLPLYIFCDGAKREDDKGVIDVRKYIKKTVLPSDIINITFRDKNLGLAANVISGVNKVFKKGYDAIIVLEDDCVPKKEFFNFMKEALNFYNLNKKIMHVSGFGMPLRTKTANASYITPYPCSWGWGTWKDRWAPCDFNDITFYKNILSDDILKKRFDWAGKSFSNFLELQLKEQINSWLIRWYVHIFKNRGLCVWATNSMLENIGFDGTGVHKVKFDRFNQATRKTVNKFIFEESIEFDLQIIKEFRQYFMGPKVFDKIKTVIYMATGIIFEKFENLSNYYK